MSSFSTTSEYKPPDFWHFPPFFTVQPSVVTREKQMRLWRDIVLDYHRNTNTHTLSLSSFSLFENPFISRKLTDEGRRIVANYLISKGNAEWIDTSQTILRIIVKHPEELAEEIYKWWRDSGSAYGNIFTFYELHSGEEHQGSGFCGTDPDLIGRAAAILQLRGKCVILEGENGEEDGIKFL